MDYQQYLSAIRRRWPWMVASIVIICGIVLVHDRLSPAPGWYQARSKIFLAQGSSHLSAEDMAEIATSNRVVWDSWYNYCKEFDTRFQTVDPPVPYMEQSVPQVIRAIRADTGSAGPTKSGVITITAVRDSPQAAVYLANQLARQATNRAIELTQFGTSIQMDVIDVELQEAQKKRDLASQRVQDFKEQHTGLIVPLDFDQAMRQVTRLEDEAKDAGLTVRENENRVRQIKRTLGTRTQSVDEAASAPSSAVIDRLRGELVAREIDLTNLRMQYTDEHPSVARTQKIIENLTARLEQELKKSFKLENAPTSLEYQFLTGDLSRYEAERLAADARRRATEDAIARAKSDLTRVPALEAEYARLNTEYLNAQRKYLDLKDKQDQQRIAIAISNRQNELDRGIGLVDEAKIAALTPGAKFQQLKVKLPIAFLVALVLGMGIILFLEGLDSSIRDVNQMEDQYQLPALGVIPELKEAALKSGSTLVLKDAPASAYAESYRIMRTNFLALARQAGAGSVVVTSSLPGEGKTTTAANFAASLAESHRRVILVDADMRNPSLHRMFGTRKEPGLSDFLEGVATLPDVILDTSIDGLAIIAAGTIPDNPARLISSPRMKELLDELSHRAEYVVIDTPPAVAFGDAMELGGIADSMIVVVGAGSKLESAHFRARSHLANMHAMLIGTVLNRVQPKEVDSYRYSTGYYPKLPPPPVSEGGKPAALPERHA